MRNIITVSMGAAALLMFGSLAAAAQTDQSSTSTSAPAATTAPATTAAPASTTTDATAASTDTDPDRIVCKEGPPPTGSRLGATRECHSQREWDRIQQEQQEALTRQQLNRGIGGSH